MGQQETFDLESVYFDTALGLDLHRRGMSLRRRTGGPDDGWHLKLPREGDRRTELQIPLGRGGANGARTPGGSRARRGA